MQRIIQLTISKDDGYYIAEGVNVPVVTQAASLDDLMENIHEVVALMLEDEDPQQYNLKDDKPSVLVNYELTDNAYAA